MIARLLGFGEIEVDRKRYDADIVIDCGQVRRRRKKPSKPYRDRFGHTPLSAEESIPWGGPSLIVGTGADGLLPLMAEVYEEAARRNVEIVALPTEAACRLFANFEPDEVNAVPPRDLLGVPELVALGQPAGSANAKRRHSPPDSRRRGSHRTAPHALKAGSRSCPGPRIGVRCPSPAESQSLPGPNGASGVRSPTDCRATVRISSSTTGRASRTLPPWSSRSVSRRPAGRYGRP